MKKICTQPTLFFAKASVLLCTTLLSLSCSGRDRITHVPDIARFDSTVISPALRDSLHKGKLVPGMPYFVASKIFADWDNTDKKVPVPSLGSRQRLQETEGWARKYVDPNIQVFLDEYETKSGKLALWYQHPDFYKMEVAKGDTLFIFWDDTVAYSVIEHLKKATALTVKDKLPKVPKGKIVYAEVHHNDHEWRKISYWYAVRILRDAQTFTRKSTGYDLYPIEFIEVNGEKVNSYQWR